MNKVEAIEKMELLVSQGWTFEVNVDNTGWRCEVVGTGLAYGTGCDLFFEKAVDLAIKNASAMEDNPTVVIGKYKDQIGDALRKAFGPIDFKIAPIEVDWEWGPTKIEVRIEASGDTDTRINREMAFYKLIFDLPREISNSITLQYDYPDEKSEVVKV